MAFRGTFDYTLDAKNRLTVPAKFRTALSDGVVLAKGVEACVEVWRPGDYDAYTETVLGERNPFSQEARQLTRFLAANAHDTELDSAGRVGVPDFLREHAGLAKEVVVAGAGDRLEVWDKGAWAEQNASLTQTVPDIAAALGA
jgi:transcriptional regulator MraZ